MAAWVRIDRPWHRRNLLAKHRRRGNLADLDFVGKESQTAAT
jgi:hypothetical protein